MNLTVGEFLREKMTNMISWVEKELGKNNLGDLKQYVAERNDTELAYVVGILRSNSNVITHRSWSDLDRLGSMPNELLELFQAVKNREDMHDKFWRYLKMFVDVISNS